MKTIVSFIAAAIIAAAAITSAEARVAVSVDFFHDNLSPYGNWRQVGDYGYCWRPNDVRDDWHPYSDGRWVYTDAGWTWDSNEPYGWATYHYGRWANVSHVGWVWIPGTEWGPGWVSWRRSPQYVGWAPLPPEARFLRTVGLNAWVDDYYDIGPGHYRFVDGRNFGARRLNSVFIDHSRNITIINQTTNITNITYVNNVIHNGGMRYEDQSRMSTEPIHRYKLNRREEFDGDQRKQIDGQFRSRVSGDSMTVFAPQLSEGSSKAPKKLAKKVEKAEINRGWDNVGSPAEVAAMRNKMKSNVAPPSELPPRAKFEKNPERDVGNNKKPDADRNPAKVDALPKAKPNKRDKPQSAEKRPSVDDRKPVADKRRPKPENAVKPGSIKKSATPAENPKNTDKIRKESPRADDMPKPNTDRKKKSKPTEPAPAREKDKGGHGVKDKDKDSPEEDAPQQPQ